MAMTQRELVIEYLLEYGSITPAKMAGQVFNGTMFGSETGKRCRELRKERILESKREGRFEKFYFRPRYIQAIKNGGLYEIPTS